MVYVPGFDDPIDGITVSDAGEHTMSPEFMAAETYRMVQEMHEIFTKTFAMVEEMQNSNGGMMGMVMKMMTGKKT